MRQEDILDEKIQKFLARKEMEYPELKESVDVMYHDLTKPHFASHFHTTTNDTIQRRKARHIRNSRLGGMRYAV
jgi:hypothetical protein